MTELTSSETGDTNVTKVPLSEVLEGLTGFESLAVEDHFGSDFAELSGTRLVIGVVAMLKRREGMSAKDAWAAAKGLTLSQLNDYFAPEVGDEDGEAGNA